MQIPLKWLIVAGLAGAAAPAQADYDLVVKKNCLACHSPDKRKYGPNFTEILAYFAEISVKFGPYFRLSTLWQARQFFLTTRS